MDVLGIFFGTVGRSTVVYITMAVCNGVYGLSVREDMQDHEIKNILCRVSLQKYVISKVLVCVIGTIAVYCLGKLFWYLAFGIDPVSAGIRQRPGCGKFKRDYNLWIYAS